MNLTRFERWYGRDEPPQQLRWLRAGPFEAALDGPDLRYVRLGGVEFVRRVYVAVRDLNWDTIDAVDSEISIDEHGEGFLARSRVRNRRSPIDFVWDGLIEGRPDGTISYSLDGRCESSFQYAKIGICVHHPARECSGRPYRATTPSGTVDGTLPSMIGPQMLDQAKRYDLPLFDPYSALSVELEDGAGVDFRFEGQLFEMEDQRNWTDASFKTASTPAYLGYVHQAEPGQRISQRVEIGLRPPRDAPGPRRSVRASRQALLTVGEGSGRRLPPIGFGLPSDGLGHSARELERVRALRPAHLRADVNAGDAAGLEAAIAVCAELSTRLELALHVDAARLDAVARLSGALDGAPIARILLFQNDRPSTPRSTVDAVRRHLPPDAPIVGGTNLYFCDINRDRPDVDGLDGVAYSINSQVHAFDELSLVEALAGHGETVISAQSLFPGTPVIVSPVTLRPRFNPAAVADRLPPSEYELPWEVDQRQMSQFGAVWTLGSIKALTDSAVSALTYYETAGWRGLFERDRGNPKPSLFRSEPGMLFPVYHLFTQLRESADAELLPVATAEPLRATGLAFRRDARLHLIIGNLTHERLTIAVAPHDLLVQMGPYGIEVVDVPADAGPQQLPK